MTNGKVLLENKHIIIGDNSYRLTIAKELSARLSKGVYVAFLSDVNSQFSISATFFSIGNLEKELRGWIIKSDTLNNPEARVFETIRRWDGVIGS